MTTRMGRPRKPAGTQIRNISVALRPDLICDLDLAVARAQEWLAENGHTVPANRSKIVSLLIEAYAGKLRTADFKKLVGE